MNKTQRWNGKITKEAKGEAAVPVVQGFKYVRLVGKLPQELLDVETERDRAGNRQLLYDPYATLLLFYFFTPTTCQDTQSARPLNASEYTRWSYHQGQ